MLKLALLLALVALPLGAQQTLIDEGFAAFYNLEYDQAISVFEKAIVQNPGRPIFTTTWRRL
jgi:outer membrane protein assembly factor BamD (BamD/ComL family)